jgi:hypothetical protein
MFALATLLGLLQLVSVRADPTPLEPSSNSVFNEGGQCTMQWTPDPTGVWTVMNIELMTGSNEQMVHLRTVGTLDGTTTNNYSYPCLAVEPNSQIYFYQFTSPNSNNVTWTTRFTIADANGKFVPPELSETNSAGQVVRYGIGKLEDQSLVDTPPPRGTSVTSPSVNSTSISAASSAPNSAATPTFTLTRNVSTNDGSDNTDPTAVTSAAAKPSQSQKGGAVSYQRSAGIGILAGAVLCGSMLL